MEADHSLRGKQWCSHWPARRLAPSGWKVSVVIWCHVINKQCSIATYACAVLIPVPFTPDLCATRGVRSLSGVYRCQTRIKFHEAHSAHTCKTFLDSLLMKWYVNEKQMLRCGAGILPGPDGPRRRHITVFSRSKGCPSAVWSRLLAKAVSVPCGVFFLFFAQRNYSKTWLNAKIYYSDRGRLTQATTVREDWTLKTTSIAQDWALKKTHNFRSLTTQATRVIDRLSTKTHYNSKGRRPQTKLGTEQSKELQ